MHIYLLIIIDFIDSCRSALYVPQYSRHCQRLSLFSSSEPPHLRSSGRAKRRYGRWRQWAEQRRRRGREKAREREKEWRARSRVRERASRRVVNRRDERNGVRGRDGKRARTQKGPHRTRHARALPGGPAHVGFGRLRATSAELVRPRSGPVVGSRRGHTDRARANASWVAFACRPAGRA